MRKFQPRFLYVFQGNEAMGYLPKHYCEECKQAEPEKKVCECGACMYRNTTQDIKAATEEGLPFFICTKCGKRHFWD
jgi:hypothetical protein